MPSSRPTPVILIFAGHDPTGGAGLGADIQTVTALGGHPVTVATLLTVQTTVDLIRVQNLDPELARAQVDALLEELPVAAIKTGALGHPEMAHLVRQTADRVPEAPLIVDPVLASETGTALADDGLIETLLAELIPRATLVTPNLPELNRLTGQDDTASAARALQASGCPWVLATGTHADTERVRNQLFGPRAHVSEQDWERLPDTYHGSGCTLAAAIATQVAQGDSIPEAVSVAQQYTWSALKHGLRFGTGHTIPRRLNGPG